MEGFDHKKIEKKWTAAWKKAGLYKTGDAVEGKENFYLLTEFPYPSGNLHVGHWYAFALPDILARYMRMRGRNVLFPMGFDAFGLPAENAAIKNKLNPRTWTQKNIEYMRSQIDSMGASFDWSREVQTIDPAYYKWTQWQFLKLYKKGLVYQKNTAVNWCPNDKTVLANEQVIEGKCERCDSTVEQKMMLQWNIKISEYADRLIDDLVPLDWPEEIKQSQRNWIGRSEGAEIDFLLNLGGKKHIVLLHGKGGSPEGDFFPWARAELEKLGHTVEAPTLPNAAAPDDIEQSEFILKNCRIDENTILVGHSAGGLAALRLLESVKAGQLVLVATPYSPTFADGKERPSVSRSILRGYDYKKIRSNVRGVVALFDAGDPIIPLSDGRAYADKLEGIFIEGRGTVGHFNGDKEPDVLLATIPTIRVFTTRPDTLYGATYLVISPEHQWVTRALQHKTVLKNNKEVQAYVEQAKRKSDLERQVDQKEKTGVLLKGVEAINPATGGKIPVYVADYVLATYGTGAIMAVPAHDERDFEFAKKFDLPIPQVVVTCGNDPLNPPQPGFEEVKRDTVIVHLRDRTTGKYALLDWHGSLEGITTAIMGGIEKGQTPEEAVLAEIQEEAAIDGVKIVRSARWITAASYCASHKNQNRCAHSWGFLAEVENLKSQKEIPADEKALHTLVWVDEKDVLNRLTPVHQKQVWNLLHHDEALAGSGYLINSGEFDGMNSQEAQSKMTEKFGRKKTTFKLRDWIVSRQRYWGVPIPIIHCDMCGAQPVLDDQLPVELPDVDDYLPEGSGKSPLAKVTSFVNVKCPKCGGAGKRETDTLDTFVDSSWYFLRYTDPKNADEFAAASKMKHWMPVDLYSGGAEHTTMHLLYSRFWHKALYDMGLVADPEPYKKRMNRSLIMGPDGQKMSKSRGNVIDPDEVVERLGADTVRMYLAFIGPYNEVSSYPWNPDGVVGVRRFLERVFRVQSLVQDGDVSEINSILHKTIKKVGDDIEVLKFNTAISQLMILLNHIEKTKKIGKTQWDLCIQLLSPLAPFVAEELWALAGHATLLLNENWPRFDESLARDEMITIAIQIDGKTRGEVTVPTGTERKGLEEAARTSVAPRLVNKKIIKTIVVPGRLVNFVLEA